MAQQGQGVERMVKDDVDYECVGKGGEEMTKGEYQRYGRIVMRFFPSYLDYKLYRRPRKCEMLKVIKAYKGAKK